MGMRGLVIIVCAIALGVVFYSKIDLSCSGSSFQIGNMLLAGCSR
jgi:hypothetical protein